MKGINSEGNEVEVIIEFQPGVLCNACSNAALPSYIKYWPKTKALIMIYHPHNRKCLSS